MNTRTTLLAVSAALLIGGQAIAQSEGNSRKLRGE